MRPLTIRSKKLFLRPKSCHSSPASYCSSMLYLTLKTLWIKPMRRFASLLFALLCLSATAAMAQVEVRAPGQQTVAVANTEMLPLSGLPLPAVARELHERNNFV